MISTILQTAFVSLIIIGFVGSILCAAACRVSGDISRSEGHRE